VKKTLAALSVGALALVAFASPAAAEPVGAPTFRDLSGLGSDTTFALMNAVSDQVLVTGTFQAENDTAATPTTYTNTKVIGSYNPQGSATVATKDAAEFAGCGAVTRANGSGAGRTALVNSIANNDNCLQFARSSSSPVVATISFIPIATDGLTFATPPNADLGTVLTLAELQGIYNEPGTAGTASCDFDPLIPQAGSGTRGDWASFVGYVFGAGGVVVATECTTDLNNSGGLVQEHNGNDLTATNQISPYSVAQYLAQSYGATTDRRNNVTLGAVRGPVLAGGATNPDVRYPIAINPNALSVVRTVGNYVSTTDFNNTNSLEYRVFRDISGAAVGPNVISNSEVCNDAGDPVTGQDIITREGFLNNFC